MNSSDLHVLNQETLTDHSESRAMNTTVPWEDPVWTIADLQRHADRNGGTLRCGRTKTTVTIHYDDATKNEYFYFSRWARITKNGHRQGNAPALYKVRTFGEYE